MASRVILFKENDGTTPVLEFLDKVPEKALLKCLVRIERLRDQGHMLRRPEADFLRDGIYELRVRHLNVNYRLLYFFHGQAIAIVSHGLTKEAAVPSKEIDRAIDRMNRFKANPKKHSPPE
jgi:phage-related protein